MFFTFFYDSGLVDSYFKNYNLNVTEVLDSDFKNAFPGIFNFTVGILNVESDSLRHRATLT